MDTHVWTRHRKTGAHWRCPVGALDTMRDLGWEPSDAPPEPTPPAVAERRRQRAQARESKPTTTARQVSRKSSKEMTDG